jgi:trk system potassium uptake protein TrkH
LGLTLFSAIYLTIGTYLILPDYPLTTNIFDAINHAMTAQSTGGFSTLDDSIAGYRSQAMERLHILPMILGGLSIPFYFKVLYERQFNQIWKDIQTRSLLVACIIGATVLSALLLHSGVVEAPFRDGVFQFISSITTTGWQTSDIGKWDDSSILFIITGAMLVGGSAGATVGGIKIIRVLLIQKGLRWHVNRFFISSNAIQMAKFNGKRLLPEEMNQELASAATFSFIYLLLVLISTLVTIYFMPEGFTLADALFEAASAQGTVGLSTGITDPTMSPVIEIVYIINMWAGRLEILPLLVLGRALVWGTKPWIE